MLWQKLYQTLSRVLKSLKTECRDPLRSSFLLMVDVVKKKNYVYQYKIDEDNALLDTLENVCYEYKLVARHEEGCIIKSKAKYYTKEYKLMARHDEGCIIKSKAKYYTKGDAQLT
ncbi:Major allergen Pru av 1 [Glycine soja]